MKSLVSFEALPLVLKIEWIPFNSLDAVSSLLQEQRGQLLEQRPMLTNYFRSRCSQNSRGKSVSSELPLMKLLTDASKANASSAT